MTWTKLGDEFSAEAVPLSDAAFRTHVEALCWSNHRLLDLLIPKAEVKRFTETPEPSAAIAELVAAGWWEVQGEFYWIGCKFPEWQRDRVQVEHRRAQLAEAQRRKRRHDLGDHSLCLPGRCKALSSDDASVDKPDDPGRDGTGRDGPGREGEGVPDEVPTNPREPEPALSVVDPSGPWSSVPADSPADRGEMCGETVVGGQRCTNPPTGRDHSGRPFCDQHLRARKTA